MIPNWRLERLIMSLRYSPLMLSCALALCMATPALAQTAASPVAFEADSLTHDENMQVLTAYGHVELEQDGRILRADQVTYNLETDTATATGNVVISEPSGDVYFADSAQLNKGMTRGLVHSLRAEMADGSRLWSETATKKSETDYVMDGARYTACKACESNPDATPPWQLKAKEVEVDQEEHTMTYRHARLEVAGVPVFYTPYFSHPDGSVERKSGFLNPDIGWTSELGGVFETRYYYDISPTTDTTFGLMATTQEGPVLKNNFRHRFEKARLEIDSSVTHSGRTDSSSGEAVAIKEEWRGHVFAELDWDINREWRAGVDVNLASDEQYLNQYDISSEDVLENEAFIERLSGRDYAGLKLMAFQDLRTGTNSNGDQPDILPSGEFSFYGAPNATLGGRWKVGGSVLNLFRDTNGQDVLRLSGDAEWERRVVAPFGLVATTDLSLRSDFYRTSDRTIAQNNPNESNSETDYRVIPTAHMQLEHPLQKRFSESTLRVTPLASLTLATDVDNDGSIPNEDSADVQLDALNLFESDRFPGLDRVEDRTHIAYGIRTGLYQDNGNHVDVLLGQSYRMHDNDIPFPTGSGLEAQESDIVGQITAGVDGDIDLDLNYRFQVDGRTMLSNRHEVEAEIETGPFKFAPSYLYARGIPGTDYTESREQISGIASVQVSDDWRFNAYTKYDLGEEPGLLKSGLGVEYTHQCYTLSTAAVRNLTDRTSGNSETSIMFRIGLKNLGEVKNSDFTLFDYE